jgi:hypothetical protein
MEIRGDGCTDVEEEVSLNMMYIDLPAMTYRM